VANYYILNLAVADELFVLTLPFLCVATFTGDWAFGDLACRLTYALRETYKVINQSINQSLIVSYQSDTIQYEMLF